PSIAKYPIIIAGHTDGVGGAEYNQRLSERRAESARQYLIAQHGIDPHRLTAKGYGKARLLLPNEPASELNRRVQFQNPNYQTAAAAAPASHPVASSPAPAAPPVQPTPTPQADGL
ncbi:MAG: OmpA family protein, partial [Xanthobacteraceae bacterium]